MSKSEIEPSPTARLGPGAWAGLALLALALRVRAAGERSLWLDEFHSLHHASAESLGALLAGLEADNHPPLSFLTLRAARALGAQSELALRLPSVLAGVVAVLLVARCAERLAGARAALVAGLVGSLSGLALQTQSEVRMYALLALAVAGLLEATSAAVADERGRLPWRAGLWTAVLLTSHYWAAHHLVLGGLAWLLGLGLAGDARAALVRPRNLAPVALGGLLAAPWYATGFVAQMTSHDLAPGGTDPGLGELAQSYLMLLFYGLGRLPQALSTVLAAAGALGLALGGMGLLAALRAADGPARRMAPLLGLTAFGLGALGFALAQVFERSGFNWTYVAGAVPALAVALGLAAALLPRPLRLVTMLLPLALALGVWPLLNGPGTEDLRGAVNQVLDEAAPEDGVLPVEWQPELFPHGLAWSHYAGQRAASTLPERWDYGEAYQVVRSLSELPTRMFVVRRGLPLDAALFIQFRKRYTGEERTDYGYGVSVHRFDGLKPRKRPQ